MRAQHRSIAYALGAAALFGASTPCAKLLGAGVPPLMLAGLLYLGSGIGLAAARAVRDRGWKRPHLAHGEWSWLAASILFGGVIGPVALMVGLARTSASTTSLLLNLESVLTALLAWIVFREHADRRIVLGMTAIVAGGAVLAWPSAGHAHVLFGPLAIALACLCWAIDNNLTRKISASDALLIAGSKGLVAGTVNVALALAAGAVRPSAPTLAGALGTGLFGYGISLVLFVVALRGLGTARTGAYFSTAPFIGAALSLALLGERATAALWAAGALMTLGVWLHLTERHGHEHSHGALEHRHPHVHDEHHRHEHDFAWDGREPHEHAHRHEPLTHTHEHFPDLHHRHAH